MIDSDATWYLLGGLALCIVLMLFLNWLAGFFDGIPDDYNLTDDFDQYKPDEPTRSTVVDREDDD